MLFDCHNLHHQCKLFSRGNSSTRQWEHFFTGSGKIALAVGTSSGSGNTSLEAVGFIGCSVMQTPFRYLGVMVGDCMTRKSAWSDIVQKLHSRLSKWKVNTLSIGVIFKGAAHSERKISWVSWGKVLASKKYGGLGVSSYYALNRTLLLKWVWRFISQDGSLWYRVIHALYGTSLESHPLHLTSNWSSILRVMRGLIPTGFNFMSHCKKRIGDGRNTFFWFDPWVNAQPLHILFPRIFASDIDKEASVATKLGSPSIDESFRRPVRDGAERFQWRDLCEVIDSVTLSSSKDRWVCDLNGDGEFRVKEVRSKLDYIFCHLLMPLRGQTLVGRSFFMSLGGTCGCSGINSFSMLLLRDTPWFLTTLFLVPSYGVLIDVMVLFLGNLG
nr:RNA-directed DNA polymerase, eukaryota, reverse transcriptase zinc-binding domain protein [Tanacetum cinerariifolium]